MTANDTALKRIELKGYRTNSPYRDTPHVSVQFNGRLVHESNDGSGNEFYVTAGGRIVVHNDNEETVLDYDWEGFIEEFEPKDLSDTGALAALDALAAVGRALGEDYEYVEEID